MKTLLAILLAPALAVAATAPPHPVDQIGPGQLKPGQYRWHPERAPQGPVLVAVSLPEQLAYVYRNGIRIGVTTVSTGRSGHPTPTGVFTILEKQKTHESSLYKGAQMPFMERLTWDGIALHAGKLPGYPASHGCVRLPMELAKLLYETTTKGGTVVIVDGHVNPAETIQPGGLLAPEVHEKKKGQESSPLDLRWEPSASPSGPVSMLLSAADRRVYVYRNGILIGEAAVEITEPQHPLGDEVYTMLEGTSDKPSSWVPGQPARLWTAVPLSEAGSNEEDLRNRIRVDPAFARQIYDLIVPGTTIYVTDSAATPETRTAPGFTVLATEETPPAKDPKN